MHFLALPHPNSKLKFEFNTHACEPSPRPTRRSGFSSSLLEKVISDLTDEERERYDRQIGPGVLSEAGQLKLKNSTALVSRVGGMGGPASQMLAMGGVGRIVLAHGGSMISADLNRQVLGQESGLGQSRAENFANTLRDRNRWLVVEALAYEPNDEQAQSIADRCDIILSCPPTFEERLRLNRVAARAGIPLIDAAQWGMSGTLLVLKAGRTACLECIYPQPPPFEELFPVVGAISSAIGSLAALEAIKIVSECGKPLWGKMLTYDGFAGRVATTTLMRRADCPCCRELGEIA